MFLVLVDDKMHERKLGVEICCHIQRVIVWEFNNRICDVHVCLQSVQCFLIDSQTKGRCVFLHVCVGKFYPAKMVFPKVRSVEHHNIFSYSYFSPLYSDIKTSDLAKGAKRCLK